MGIKLKEGARIIQQKGRPRPIHLQPAVKKEIKKLSKIEIKKMKPPQLKDALKERGLSTQGNKKELIKRLTEANE